MAKGYTVSLMNDIGWTESCHPLAVGVEKCVAKSIYRHFEKVIRRLGLWSDYNQTGYYVMMTDRKYCINHKDFEVESGTPKARMTEIEAEWENRNVEDATAEPEWEEYEGLLEYEAEIEAMWKEVA